MIRGIGIPLILCSKVTGTIDACRFVGLRLAKVWSECESGTEEEICTRFAADRTSGMFIPVAEMIPELRPITCAEAEGMLESILRPHSPVGDISGRVAAVLETDLIPAFKRMLFMGTPADEQVVTAMAEVDLSLLQMANSSPEALQYIQWGELTDLADLFLSEMRRSFPRDELWGPFFHILMDLLSLVSLNLINDQEGIVIHSGVAHRSLYPFELVMNVSHLSPAFFLTLSNVLEDFGKSRLMSTTNLGVVLAAAAALPYARTGNAIEEILKAHIREVVCPILRYLFQTVHFPNAWIKASLNLIAICRGRTSVAQLGSISLHLGGFRRFHPGISFINPESLHFDSSVPWINGFSDVEVPEPCQAAVSILQQYSYKHGIVTPQGQLRLKSSFDSPIIFQLVMLGYGRSLGLAVRYCRRGFVIPTRLSDSIFSEIHNSPNVSEQLELGEQLFHIRNGVKDVVGPVGVNVFSIEEWRRFIPRATIPPALTMGLTV